MGGRVFRSGVRCVAALLIAFGLTATPDDARAEWFVTWQANINNWANWGDWHGNEGPFPSLDALEQGAIAWCHTQLAIGYYGQSWDDCDLFSPSTVTFYDQGGSEQFYQGSIMLKGGLLMARWYLGNDDEDCLEDVVDRVTGYGCIDPADLFVVEPPPPPPTCPGSNETNPCNPADGNKSQREVDYRAPSNGGLSFERRYNSKGAYKTAQGMAAGWRHTYSRTLDEVPDSKPTVLISSPADQSSFYYSAADACNLGFDDIKSTVWSGELATATATFVGGGDCKISMGGVTVAHFSARSAARVMEFSSPAGIRTLVRSNGSAAKFEVVGGAWVSELNPTLKLDGVGSGWVFTDTNDTQESYDATGKLTAITYRNGQTETLGYDLTVAQGGDDDDETLDKVTGAFGHTLAFSYDTNGLLSTVTTADGVTQYGYDADDNLVSVTYPDTSIRQYVYEDTDFPNHLTGIVDENGDRFAIWAYDDAGRAILSEHAGGQENVQLAYNANGTTTLTMANGSTRTYTFTTEQGQRRLSSLTGDVCSTCAGGNVKSRTYDSNGFVDETTDWIGNVTKTTRNARGLVETLTEALGEVEQRVTTTVWESNYRLPTSVTSPQNVTTFTYDTSGNVLTSTISGGGASRTWTLTYNANGQVLTVNGPRTGVSDITTLAYYNCTNGGECGQIKSVTNALGHVTNYDEYDTAGRLTKMTDANGLETTNSYDINGQIVTITQTPTAGAPRVTGLTYDNVGQLATNTLPNGEVLTYAYDAAHNVTSVTDALGNSIHYSYDLMGNIADEETYDPNNNLSRAIAYTRDNNYRLDTLSSGGFTTDIAFDLVGNLTTETDPGSAVTQHVYDALNRIDTTTDALSGVVDYNYDDHDNLTQVVAPNGATTSYAYDPLDNLETETSADRGLLTNTHDEAGNRETATDARGVTATYTYDALDRIVTVSYPDTSENIAYAYDNAASNGIGRLTSINDQSGTTTYTFDEFGNVASDTRVVSGVTYATTYQYDSVDNIASIGYPSGRVVDYVRDSAGQVTQVTSTKGGIGKTIVSSASYDPVGPLTSLLYGNGMIFNYQYGLDNRVTSITSSGNSALQYNYDGAANVSKIYDTLDANHTQNFEYDALMRLVSEEMTTDYATLIALDNPIAYWRLGEASGSVAVDASGNGYDGVYSENPTRGMPSLTGGPDTAMRAPKGTTATQYIEGTGYVNGPTLTGKTVTAVETWFQSEVTGGQRDILTLFQSDSDKMLINHRIDETIKILKRPQSGWLLESDGAVSSNVPHHIAVWYEASSNKSYFMIDGVIQQDNHDGNVLAVTNPKVFIAAYKHNNYVMDRYKGIIDEVVVYDDAKTSVTFIDRINWLSAGSPGNDFAYDANGNRLSIDDGNNVTTLAYQAQSNQLTTIGGVTVQHDLAGNQIGNGTRSYSYDNTNRLSAVLDNGVQTASYVHNALGQRTQKTVGSTNTIYIYDLRGGLLAEHDDTGTLIRDYVRLNGTPIAQIEQSEVVSYLHFDHLGTPRLATDDSQVVVWRWDGDAFGGALPDADPDGDGTSVSVNLRFPGQYYDQESGLNYNYHRTFDPSKGRYLESDPIGLGGGLNTYGYVGANPLSSIDPFGLYSPLNEFDKPLPVPDWFAKLMMVLAEELTPFGTVKDTADFCENPSILTGAGFIPFAGALFKRGPDLAKQAKDLVPLNGGRSRVTVRSPSQKLELDLQGRPHGDVPTPHTKVSERNLEAPRQPAYNTRNAEVRPATQEDIRTARRYLERQD